MRHALEDEERNERDQREDDEEPIPSAHETESGAGVSPMDEVEEVGNHYVAKLVVWIERKSPDHRPLRGLIQCIRWQADHQEPLHRQLRQQTRRRLPRSGSRSSG